MSIRGHFLYKAYGMTAKPHPCCCDIVGSYRNSCFAGSRPVPQPGICRPNVIRGFWGGVAAGLGNAIGSIAGGICNMFTGGMFGGCGFGNMFGGFGGMFRGGFNLCGMFNRFW